MDVNTEAKRILAMSISKLYSSRSQRGGLRLHRSLLLSLVMRSARDIYHTAQLARLPQGSEEEVAERVNEERKMDHSGLYEAQTATNSSDTTSSTTGEPQSSCDGDMTEDKENASPARQSRKRRGKTSVAPDFLPSKRARLEPGEERHAMAGFGTCRSGMAETLTALSFNPIISAC